MMIACLLAIFFIVIADHTVSLINKNIKVVKKEKINQKSAAKESTPEEEQDEYKEQEEFEKDNQGREEQLTISESSVTEEETSNSNFTTDSNSISSLNPVTSNNQPVEILPIEETKETVKGEMIEQEVLAYINDLRSSLNLSLLEWDNSIYSYARIRAQELITLYSHIRPTGESSLSSAPVLLHTENIGYGQTAAREIFTDWKNSPAHYQNLINPEYTRGAIACIYSEEEVPYWVYLAY